MLSISPRWSTLGRLLETRAAREPERRAYVFLLDGETDESILTYAGMDAAARRVAATLAERGVRRGDRVLLPLAAGRDAVLGFFGCVYAGALAVFVPPVLSARRAPAAARVIADARPAAILGAGADLARARSLLAAHVGGSVHVWIDLDRDVVDEAASWRAPATTPDTPAYLQYASGATTTPRGVVITHANVLANVAAIEATAPQTRDSVSVQWLPLFHDMGLVTTLYNLSVGFPCVMFLPTQFSQRPLRWLEAMSRYRATAGGGPDSAYAACADLAATHDLSALDLSAWELAFCGAEPVRSDTMRRFADAFAPNGFRAGALFPCYGLAEATLSVSGGHLGRPPVARPVAAAALRHGRADSPTDPAIPAIDITSCGPPVPGHDVRIVDADSCRELPVGMVGEIWVRGPSVSPGYWDRPELTAAVFGGHLAGSGDGSFLRTGDHGFLAGGELHVTGRLKDLIIVNGANHYPQDIEATVRQSHACLRRVRGAAFAVGDHGERLVVVHEVDRRQVEAAVLRALPGEIRLAVADRHGIDPDAVVLVRAETVPVTSSGKVQRYLCRDAFLSGGLAAVAEWRRPTVPAAAPPADVQRHDAVERWLLDYVARRTALPHDEIDTSRPLAEYGLESSDAVAIALALERLAKREVPATVVYSYPSIGELADYLGGRGAHAAPPAASPAPAPAARVVSRALLEEELGT